MKRIIKKSGFTLIELIVVMAVIGILVLLAAPKFLGYTQKAQETKYIHTAKVIETALEAHLINGGLFPEDLEVVDESALTEAMNNNSLYGVNGLISSPDGETYYELTHKFIQKLDVKLSVKNEIIINALASSVPTALYASEKGITLVDKAKTLKGYELQDGDFPNEINPLEVNQIATGNAHVLALMNDGTVKAWGNNAHGQLGVVITDSKSSTPINVDSLSEVKEVIAGDFHSLALMNDGTVKAWGNNSNGQLGDGTNTNHFLPKTISGLTNVKELVAGGNFSLALLEDGSVKAWGGNNYGQLGDATTSNKLVPTTINGLTNVKQLTAGWAHNFAIMNDGTVKAWGYNFYGQLGNGIVSQRSTPVIISGLNGVLELIAGDSHSFALMDNGTVKAWGLNASGQFGDGTVVNKLIPTTINGLTNVKQLAAGNYHSLALMDDGKVYAWGRNIEGQLGDGNNIGSGIPIQVTSLPSSVKKLIADTYYSLALMGNGRVVTWGYNTSGQLGDGTTSNKSTPTLITIE